MAKLTEKTLQAVKPEDHGKTLFDEGGLRGMVRASKSGAISISFSWRYRFSGKQKDLRMGTWPGDSLASIRRERDKARSILDASLDPAIDRKTVKLQTKVAQEVSLSALQEQLARSTVQDLFDRWLKLELCQRKESSRAELVRAFNKDVLPMIGQVPAEDVTKAHIMKVLDAMLARGARRLANRTLSELRQMFGFGLTREIVQVDPTHRIKKTDVGGREKERDRTLAEDEISELAARLLVAKLYRPTECAIWIMLSTGCRIGDLMKAEWREVDLNNGTWTFTPEKDQAHITRTHTVHLSDFTLTWLERLQEMTGTSPWLFPNRVGNAPVCKKSVTKQIADRQSYEDEGLKKPMMNRAKNTDTLSLSGGRWTPHDLRRTCTTLMVDLGVADSVADKAIYHLDPNRMRRIYIRADQVNALKEAWRMLGERLDLLTRQDETHKVAIGRFGKAFQAA